MEVVLDPAFLEKLKKVDVRIRKSVKIRIGKATGALILQEIIELFTKK